jgi:hypothetical protein
MKQTIIVAKPPVYDRCDARFNIKGKPVLFSWGDKIFNPANVDIPRYLLAHEAVHGERQLKMGIEGWWDAYLEDEAFRFEEERMAHRAEWLAYSKWCKLEQRAPYLEAVAARLSGSLYGNMVTLDEARAAILARAS